MRTTVGEDKSNSDIIRTRFELTNTFKDEIQSTWQETFGYGQFGKILFYRTYSRKKEDGTMENWADCVIRVIEGVMSIRKSHYKQNKIPWDNSYWNDFAKKMTTSMFYMRWLPPGRGLWAMGTEFMYERGSMPLYNCAATYLHTETLADDLAWSMDALMNGVGVGFGISDDKFPKAKLTTGIIREIVQITDTREGWCDSVRMLINSKLDQKGIEIEFDYSKIRKKGTPIKGFGGTCSGSDSLKTLHGQIRIFFDRYRHNDILEYTATMLRVDLANVIGCCVVAGNVRRSAEITICNVSDPVFKDLKDYTKYPYRESFGWMSNNSVTLSKHEDFERMGEIAERVRNNGEPGYLNLINMKYGRLRTAKSDRCVIDKAKLLNPCGEIPLESKEVCNLAETFPTMCLNISDWFRACEFATFYTSTVTLLPTHSEPTNRMVLKNRRIGISFVDFTGWKSTCGLNKVIRWMRNGYNLIRKVNKDLANESGIPASIRVTTIKPGGTIPKLPGRTSGGMHPNFKYMIRRFNIDESNSLCERLDKAGIPSEASVYSPNTLVYEMPLECTTSRPVSDVSIWEQAANLVCLQENWADNSVSNTLMFKEEESDQLESLLSHLAPKTKSVSLLKINAGAYEQMPEEGITEIDYQRRMQAIKKIDFSSIYGDSTGEAYCEGDSCEIQ